jgi:hypothetical protein
MTKVNEFPLSGKYLLSGNKFTPLHPDGTLKEIRIMPSKYKGRADYLAAVIVGNYKPQFISTIYEPRTKDGWFNVESEGIRYEVVKHSETEAEIIKLGSRKGGDL